MNIQLSDHFDTKRLLRFALPSILMMVFTSVYGVVDGLFVSNFVGKTPFAAVNFIMPFLMILGALGFMLGTLVTIPSRGILSPGFTTIVSPTFKIDGWTSVSLPAISVLA